MANLVFNQGLGRIAEYAQQVEDNSPASTVFRVFLVDKNSETDENIREVISFAHAGAALVASVFPASQ